ncbi:short-chain dehydrogenase/reductase SDR [Sulfobacillus acidophilus TPY]|uniref:Short-chain dehydrogenase/reductase SDR n=1 Tax=Sulfobacillus acidophilus (strain ATCC 700253 / DSM 10332 / NAL) TaxID=679936 RepID=G8U096_SULAD|nr:short-chain dehydrogenase/reductase SDR [Sulfobacillus acidophilus TPY]AEW06438.1 short-chain dehydrogenase/reductase SDR [Sulfobacillus acidophilus DSM 10332]
MENHAILGTGLSSGIGRALIPLLMAEGPVVALGRQHPGPGVEFVPADFRDPDRHYLAELDRVAGNRPFRGFVHVAGVVFSDKIETGTLSEWDATWRVNCDSAYALGRWLVPRLTAPASIVLVGSVDAWYQSQDGPAASYGASKAALVGLMRQWAAEWGPRGIRVNVVAPGALNTGNGPQAGEVVEQLQKRIALGRLGRAPEVASVIHFLLSPASSYITGAVIPVDGGLNLTY